jgi:hypothetical protein
MPTRKRFAIVLSVVLVVLIGLVCVEVYAHTYVHVDVMPVVTSDYALKSVPIINGTRTFSSNGAEWLLVLSSPAFRSSVGVVFLYVFKTQENKGFFAQSVDLVGVDFDVESTPIGIHPASNFRFGLCGSNCTEGVGQYITTLSGTLNVDFGFTFKVYEETLVGILQVDETTVHFNETMAIPVTF